jgi:lysozyme family protein
MNFDRAVALILDIEGGYTMDPNDPGGETNFGISKRSYPDLDIKNLTAADATAIYLRDFWVPCQCATYHNGLDLLVFDAAVNQGVSAAIRMLQTELGVETDGVVGPATISALQRKPIATAQYAARRMLTYGLNPNFTRYGLGWSRRLMRICSVALST